MAIFKSVINVNNGNTGWTKQDVLDALETAFAQLGFNGGSPVIGSPVVFVAPGGSITTGTAARYSAGDNTNPGFPYYGQSQFRFCGGPPIVDKPVITRSFYVTNNGTSSYNFAEQWFLDSYSSSNDTLTITSHNLATGTPLIFNPGGLVSATISPLVNDTTYYVINVDSNTIKLASTLNDANNGTAIPGWSVSSSWNTIPFRRPANNLYDNYQIDVENGDTLKFEVNDTGSGQFFLVGSHTTSTSYSTNYVLSTTNYEAEGWKEFPTGQGTTNVSWQVRGWPQTEDENQYPDYIPGTGLTGIHSYGYANSVNPAMKGVIRILPSTKAYTSHAPYWKYTVPASGSRSQLKIKVHRLPSGLGSPSSAQRAVSGIEIYSKGSGWGTDEAFVIPGSAIGGVNGTNDISVGVNSLTTAQATAFNGVCNLLVTNYGGGSTMYQKSLHGKFAVLKNINDSTKTFGTTYYSFRTSEANSYQLSISSGPMWNALNRRGVNANYDAQTYSGQQFDYGYFLGDNGLDIQLGWNYPYNGSNAFSINYAQTSTPTAYPLAIRIYKAQAPQDSNYAVIQFTQTVNGVINPHGAFSIHRGPGVGANVWDLNHVWNGGLTEYYTGYSPGTAPDEGSYPRAISMSHIVPGYRAHNSQASPQAEPATADGLSLAREANYGYLRNQYHSYGAGDPRVTYECNIDTSNNTYNEPISVMYYRNSDYDAKKDSHLSVNKSERNKKVSPAQNFYKPIKGIPISNQLIPCPYYLPDDFILLQVSTSPGATMFRPGDTVTISSSEVYEIIIGAYDTLSNGLDDVAGNSSMGMLFCARVV